MKLLVCVLIVLSSWAVIHGGTKHNDRFEDPL